MTVHLVVLVGPLLLVIIADCFAVGPVLDTLLVVCLEVLVPASQDASAIFLVIFEGSLVYLLLIIAVCYFTTPVLHVVLELPIVNRIAHLQHSPSALLSVIVVTLIVISIGPGQPTSPVELVVLDTSFVACT